MPLWLLKAVLYPLVVGILLLACYRWSHRQLIDAASKVPCAVPPWPILGHLHYLLGGYDSTSKFMVRMWQESRVKGHGAICVWVGPIPIIVVHGVDDIKKLLSNNSMVCRGIMTWLSKPFLGDGLLTAPVDHWRTTRKHLDLLFHPSNLDHMMPALNQISHQLIDELSDHTGGATVNLQRIISTSALQTVSQLTFGLDQSFEKESTEFRQLADVIDWIPELFVTRVINPLLWRDQFFNFLYRTKIYKIHKTLKSFIKTPLEVARKNIRMNKRRVSILDYYETNNRTDLKHGEPLTAVRVYSFLQEAGVHGISDKQLQDEIVTLLTTGTDTVGCAVSSCLLALAQYQDMQEKLFTEICAVMGSDKNITQDHLKRLPYLDRIVKETLRWSTVVPFIVRYTTEPVNMSMCRVPAGTTIFLCIGGALTDPKSFPEPHKFDPDRFSQKNSSNIERQAFIPFGGGPRNCIGKTYAQMFMKVIVVHIIRNYKLNTKMNIHSMNRRVSVLMESTEGYKVTLSERGSNV